MDEQEQARAESVPEASAMSEVPAVSAACEPKPQRRETARGPAAGEGSGGLDPADHSAMNHPASERLAGAVGGAVGERVPNAAETWTDACGPVPHWEQALDTDDETDPA